MAENGKAAEKSEPVQYTLDLGGEKRRIEFDMNSMIAIKELTGENVAQIAVQVTQLEGENKFKPLRTLLWGSLITYNPDFELPTQREGLMRVGRMMKFSEFPKIAETLALALGDYFEMEGFGGMKEFPGQLAPFVPSPEAVVQAMVAAAHIQHGDHVIDMGAGDGRLMLATVDAFGGVAVTVDGYELQAERYRDTLEKIKSRKLNGSMNLYQSDIRQAKIDRADVVFMYLLQTSNQELEAKLKAELKPGARVISHDYTFADWDPAATVTVQCPDRAHKVYTFIQP